MFDQQVIAWLDAQLLYQGCLGVARHTTKLNKKSPVPVTGTGPL